MERHRLPMVETRGQQRRFQSGGARALWISLIVGGIDISFELQMIQQQEPGIESSYSSKNTRGINC